MSIVDDWRMMATAPKDGTKVRLLIRNDNFNYDDINPSQWEQDVIAEWIDHNGGGWTWQGFSATPIGWRPLS